MFAISNFLFVTTLVPAIFTMQMSIPSSSGLVSQNVMYPQLMTQNTPEHGFYPYNQLPQTIVQRGQPQFMSNPSKINGVNPNIFARQPSPMIQEYNPFSMTGHPEMQRSPFVPLQLMSNPSMQGYQHPNQMMVPMPMQMPMQTDQLKQHMAFLIQSANARLHTYLALAEKLFPQNAYNSQFVNNMGQSGLFPLPYAQQYQSKAESQENLGEEILEQQQQNANEQQQVIDNEAELENKRRLELEQQEIEREKREAEEKIKQEQEEEMQKQVLERKEREKQEMRLQQIEEAERKKKYESIIPKPNRFLKDGPLQQKSSNKVLEIKPTENKNSGTKSIDEQIKSISQKQKQKPVNLKKIKGITQ